MYCVYGGAKQATKFPLFSYCNDFAHRQACYTLQSIALYHLVFIEYIMAVQNKPRNNNNILHIARRALHCYVCVNLNEVTTIQ